MSKLYFRHAAMGAGKTMHLLQAAFNYEERGMGVRLYTAEIDNRCGEGVISSRIGIKREAHTFDRGMTFDYRIMRQGVNCIFIDEAQFLTKAQVQQLHRLAHVGKIPIICYGLRSDFKGNGFEGAAELLILADDIEEIKTICECGKKASMNARFDLQGDRVTDGAQVLIGGNSTYRAMCPSCFYRESPKKTNPVQDKSSEITHFHA